jgi:hypothetical protein
MSPIILLIIALAVGLIMVAVLGGSNTPKRRSKAFRSNRSGSVDRAFVRQKWESIELLVNGHGSLREAVMEADMLLDYVLKKSGARGETLGERLKSSGSRFSNCNDVWTAHKLRNSLAHESDFDLVPSQAKEALKYFKQGLKDLGAL